MCKYFSIICVYTFIRTNKNLLVKQTKKIKNTWAVLRSLRSCVVASAYNWTLIEISVSPLSLSNEPSQTQSELDPNLDWNNEMTWVNYSSLSSARNSQNTTDYFPFYFTQNPYHTFTNTSILSFFSQVLHPQFKVSTHSPLTCAVLTFAIGQVERDAD